MADADRKEELQAIAAMFDSMPGQRVLRAIESKIDEWFEKAGESEAEQTKYRLGGVRFGKELLHEFGLPYLHSEFINWKIQQESQRALEHSKQTHVDRIRRNRLQMPVVDTPL